MAADSDFPAVRVGFLGLDPESTLRYRVFTLNNDQRSMAIGRATSRAGTSGFQAANNNMWVVCPVMSRNHATVELKADGCVWIKDVGSAHGTVVNGIRIGKNCAQMLNNCDTVKFGTAVVRGIETFDAASFKFCAGESPITSPTNQTRTPSSFACPEESEEESESEQMPAVDRYTPLVEVDEQSSQERASDPADIDQKPYLPIDSQEDPFGDYDGDSVADLNEEGDYMDGAQRTDIPDTLEHEQPDEDSEYDDNVDDLYEAQPPPLIPSSDPQSVPRLGKFPESLLNRVDNSATTDGLDALPSATIMSHAPNSASNLPPRLYPTLPVIAPPAENKPSKTTRRVYAYEAKSALDARHPVNASTLYVMGDADRRPLLASNSDRDDNTLSPLKLEGRKGLSIQNLINDNAVISLSAAESSKSTVLPSARTETTMNTTASAVPSLKRKFNEVEQPDTAEIPQRSSTHGEQADASDGFRATEKTGDDKRKSSSASKRQRSLKSLAEPVERPSQRRRTGLGMSNWVSALLGAAVGTLTTGWILGSVDASEHFFA